MSERELIDRYSLALAVLDGEQDAHRILGDLLEESGDRGLAQWARSRKGKTRKKLDFVLAILPCRVAVLTACDFAERIGPRRLGPGGLRLIEEVRSRVSGLPASCSDSIEALRDMQKAIDLPDHTPLIWKCLRSLVDAGQFAVVEASYVQEQQRRPAAHAAREALREVRQVARHASNLGSEVTWPKDEVRWQLEHIKQVVRQLLRQGTDGGYGPLDD